MNKTEELRQKINEAVKNGKYFITISVKDGHRLQHYFAVNRGFLSNDIIPSIDHIKADIEKKVLFPVPIQNTSSSPEKK